MCSVVTGHTQDIIVTGRSPSAPFFTKKGEKKQNIYNIYEKT